MRWLKQKEVRNRVLYTSLLVLIFQIGTIIPLPKVSSVVEQNGLSSLLNIFSGGAFGRAGLFVLGISPYITASILFQLLPVIFDGIKTMQKTPEGRAKLGQWQRIITLVLAGLQGYGLLFTNAGLSLGIIATGNFQEKVVALVLIMTGSLFTSYLGTKIDERGVGQGVSVLIATGILSSMIQQFIFIGGLYSTYKAQGNLNNYFVQLGILVAMFLFVSIVSYFANKKEFKLPIQSMQNKEKVEAHYFPIKLLTSSVMPVIFTVSAITALGLFNTWFSWGIGDWLNYYTNKGFVLYVGLICLFAFVFNLIQYNTDEIEENFKNGGIYILGVKQSDISKYLTKKIMRITFIGTPILVFIASVAILLERFLDNQFGLQLIGTSLLIIIGVATEIIHQIRGLTDKHSYKEVF